LPVGILGRKLERYMYLKKNNRGVADLRLLQTNPMDAMAEEQFGTASSHSARTKSRGIRTGLSTSPSYFMIGDPSGRCHAHIEAAAREWSGGCLRPARVQSHGRYQESRKDPRKETEQHLQLV
jgi:hypothetical protein